MEKPSKTNKHALGQNLMSITKSIFGQITKALKISGRGETTAPGESGGQNISGAEHVSPSASTGAGPSGGFESARGKESSMDITKDTIEKTRSSAQLSSRETPPKPEPKPEPESVWHGEEGPELPREYGRTLLQAMPRDPNWVYLYWEISEDTRRRLMETGGEWIFEVSTPTLRIHNGDGFLQEIPILLDAMSWYVSLPSSRDYEFELGLKQGDAFHLIARSNRISLSAAEPSGVLDEEWAMVEERFQEMLHTAGAGGFPSLQGSAEVQPHLFRHRVRVPWNITMLHNLPSSHGMVSSGAFYASRNLPGSHSAYDKNT